MFGTVLLGFKLPGPEAPVKWMVVNTEVRGKGLGSSSRAPAEDRQYVTDPARRVVSWALPIPIAESVSTELL